MTLTLMTVITALALVLIIEDLLPFVAPRLWRDTFRRIMELTDGQVRFVGLASLALGALLLVIAGMQ